MEASSREGGVDRDHRDGPCSGEQLSQRRRCSCSGSAAASSTCTGPGPTSRIRGWQPASAPSAPRPQLLLARRASTPLFPLAWAAAISLLFQEAPRLHPAPTRPHRPATGRRWACRELLRLELHSLRPLRPHLSLRPHPLPGRRRHPRRRRSPLRPRLQHRPPVQVQVQVQLPLRLRPPLRRPSTSARSPSPPPTPPRPAARRVPPATSATSRSPSGSVTRCRTR